MTRKHEADNQDDMLLEATDALESQLSAYLDGELDEDTRRLIETNLASDAQLRARLAEMEEAWTFLDMLESDEADESFTQSTMEMVAVQAEEDVAKSKVHRSYFVWLCVLVLGVCSCAGYFSAAAMWPGPDDRLLADLPILENLDAYRQADSVEFLVMLHEKGLFITEASVAAQSAEAKTESVTGGASTELAPAVVPVSVEREESMKQREARIEAMDGTARQALLRNLERFEAMPEDERQQLRDFYEELSSHDDADELQRIALAYYDFLKPPLTSSERRKLQGMPAEERIQEIAKLLERPVYLPGREWLPEELRDIAIDGDKLVDWFDTRSKEAFERILEQLPEDQRQATRSQYEEIAKQHGRGPALMIVMRFNPQMGELAGKAHKEEDLDEAVAELRRLLPPALQEHLSELDPREQLGKLTWLASAELRSRRRPSDRDREQRLVEHFKEDMREAKKEQLLSMSPDVMLKELQRSYDESSRLGGMGGPNLREWRNAPMGEPGGGGRGMGGAGGRMGPGRGGPGQGAGRGPGQGFGNGRHLGTPIGEEYRPSPINGGGMPPAPPNEQGESRQAPGTPPSH